MTNGWIVIPNWDKFQHYGDTKPGWIKFYTNLAHRDEWCHLTLAERGLLCSLWLEFALSNGQLRVNDVTKKVMALSRRRHFDSLLAAGFLEVSSRRPPELRARAKKKRRKEKDNPQPPSEKGAQDFSNDLQPGRRKPTAKELRRYTGCSYRRGSHGSTYVQDVLGTAKPPPDWPYPKPEPDEIRLHLEMSDR